jgi:uncharacterized protein (UPF0548 family)
MTGSGVTLRRQSPRAPSRLVRSRLAALADAPVNYDIVALDVAHPSAGWLVDDRCQALPSEPPGDPISDGSFEIAVRLIRGYEFADPSIVRALYDPQSPLKGRNMLLELRALGLISIRVGVRVVDVYDHTRSIANRPVCISGWSYRTLAGHVEQGQMDWQVWKWTDTGAVEFHVHAVSRPAPLKNPFVRFGFLLLRRHERALFLDSTQRRMRLLTEAGLRSEGRGERIRLTSSQVTARRLAGNDPTHEELARRAETPDLSG